MNLHSQRVYHYMCFGMNDDCWRVGRAKAPHSVLINFGACHCCWPVPACPCRHSHLSDHKTTIAWKPTLQVSLACRFVCLDPQESGSEGRGASTGTGRNNGCLDASSTMESSNDDDALCNTCLTCIPSFRVCCLALDLGRWALAQPPCAWSHRAECNIGIEAIEQPEYC